MSSLIVFFPARQSAEGNSRGLIEILGEQAPSYATAKTCVAQVNVVIFSPVLGHEVTTPEIIY